MIKENTQFKLRSSLRQFAGVHEEISTNLKYSLLSITLFQLKYYKNLPALTYSSSKGNFSIDNATYTPIVRNPFLKPLSGRYPKHLIVFGFLTGLFSGIHCFMHWLTVGCLQNMETHILLLSLYTQSYTYKRS